MGQKKQEKQWNCHPNVWIEEGTKSVPMKLTSRKKKQKEYNPHCSWNWFSENKLRHQSYVFDKKHAMSKHWQKRKLRLFWVEYKGTIVPMWEAKIQRELLNHDQCAFAWRTTGRGSCANETADATREDSLLCRKCVKKKKNNYTWSDRKKKSLYLEKSRGCSNAR